VDLRRQAIAWPAAVVNRRPDQDSFDDHADDDAHPDDEHKQIEAFRGILGTRVESRLWRIAARGDKHRQPDRRHNGSEAVRAQTSQTTQCHVTPAGASRQDSRGVKYNPN